jgi:hypothetical protein
MRATQPLKLSLKTKEQEKIYFAFFILFSPKHPKDSSSEVVNALA